MFAEGQRYKMADAKEWELRRIAHPRFKKRGIRKWHRQRAKSQKSLAKAKGVSSCSSSLWLWEYALPYALVGMMILIPEVDQKQGLRQQKSRLNPERLATDPSCLMQ